MIHLLQPKNLRGIATGGYRYNAAIAKRLEAAGLGCAHDVTPEEFCSAALSALRIEPDSVIVIDSLFLELCDPPAWLREMSARVLLLMHFRPSASPLLSPEERNALEAREQRWAKLAVSAIATGGRLAERLARDLDVHSTVATPGVESCFRQPAARRLETHPRNGSPLEIVSVGALAPSKGQLELVKLLAPLAQKRPLRLTLIGDAEGHADYAGLLESHRGSLDLHLAGDLRSEEVSTHLARADLFVSASRFESYGMSVAEAVASNLPVLGYDVGELDRWIDRGVDGHLVAADDPALFAERLGQLVLSDDARRELLQNRRQRFFPTWEYTFGRFLAACHPRASTAHTPCDQVSPYSSCELPTRYGVFQLTIYRLSDGEEAILLQMGVLNDDDPPFVRVHSECFTGETLHSLKCDCRAQLENGLEAVAERGRGAIIYLRQEGRGIGLGDKVRAYAEQERGADTVEANELLGLPVDLRDFRTAAVILSQHGVSRVRLNTNNPDKVAAFEDSGLHVVEVIGSHSTPTADNQDYLQTKVLRMGHIGLEDVVGAPPASINGAQAGCSNGQGTSKLAIFDLDGVIQMGEDVPTEARELIERLRAQGHLLRFLTNDGVNTRAIRSDMLRRHGLEVDPAHIYTGASLAARYVRELGGGPLLALCGDPALEEFDGLELVRQDARIVVVGDFFEHYDIDLLRAAHHSLEKGARLVAIHRKRTWPNQGKRLIDIGFWVAGLEYCAEKPAAIVAKPAAYSYRAVMQDAGVSARNTIMVSDEFAPDLEGALRCGIRAVHFQPAADAPSKGRLVAHNYRDVEEHLSAFRSSDGAIRPTRTCGDS